MNANLPPAGYIEIAHTADWSLQVWAPDLGGLFDQSLQGMYSLMGATFGSENGELSIQLRGIDSESLLVQFLSEMLFLLSEQGQVCRVTSLEVESTELEGKLHTYTAGGVEKEIKAVTFHQLEVARGDSGWMVTITFDV